MFRDSGEVKGHVDARGPGAHNKDSLVPEGLRLPVVVAVEQSPFEVVNTGHPTVFRRVVMPT